MRFQILDILPYQTNPVTGRLISPADRFAQVVQTARIAEESGFDAFAIGERHAGRFISSGVSALLGAIAATTSRIRIQTGVTVLSILDPVRVAEDYATLDQLSRGRVEITIGKGNEARHFPLFGLYVEDQWDLMAEKYELLRRLWREEDVTWAGEFRPPLDGVTTLPRPYAGAPRVWHGSATTLASASLAAKWGDPLFTANAIQPRRNYQVLIEHYRSEHERHGHDPRFAYLGSGSGSCFIADTTQQATYGHDLQSVNLPTTVPFEEQLTILERLATEVIPAVRKAAPTTLWTDADPYGGRPAFAGRTVPDAAAVVEAARLQKSGTPTPEEVSVA